MGESVDPTWLTGDAVRGRGRGGQSVRRCKRYHKFPSNPCVHNEFGDVVILFDGEVTGMQREGGRVEWKGGKERGEWERWMERERGRGVRAVGSQEK